jgi:hypothetical protein
VDSSGTREIEEAVQRALAAGGIQGTVTLTGRTLSLRAGGAPVEIDALYLIEQWPLLPEELRGRKAADVAARLADAHQAAKAGAAAPSAMIARPSVRPTGAPARGPKKPIVVPLGTLLLVVLSGVVLWLFFRDRSKTPPPAPSASARAESEDERRARVCEVARKRVLETGTLAQLDAEVWLAELWLATSKPGEDMARSKALAGLVDQGKLTAAADPELAALREARVEVVGEEAAPGLAFRGMHVRFRGGYVSAFFDAAGREKMNRVAGLLADATFAEMGALYGRCAHLAHHDIGAWVRGATPALASAALVYSMGFFSERRLTNRDPSSPPTASDLAAVVAAAAKLDKARVETAVRDAGGTFAPGIGEAPTQIVFALGGPTRAARASGLVATAAGMGPDAPRPGAPGAP